MDLQLLISEIKNVAVENGMLIQEIKEIRKQKNIEIDEIEQLYNKTKQELEEKSKIIDEIYKEKLKYNNYNIVKQLSEITDFKKQDEYKQFKSDFITFVYNPLKYVNPIGLIDPNRPQQNYNIFLDKYKHLLPKIKVLNINIQQLLQKYGRILTPDTGVQSADVIFDIYDYLFEIDIRQMYNG
jgi:hypothetical protein